MNDWRKYLTADEARRLDEIIADRQHLMQEKLKLHDKAKKRRQRAND